MHYDDKYDYIAYYVGKFGDAGTTKENKNVEIITFNAICLESICFVNYKSRLFR